MKIDFGCGSSKKKGYIGVDILDLSEVDIVHDLNCMPYPFSDSEIDEIWMDQVLEHVNDPVRVVEELFRICKNGATLTIGVPYFRSFYSVIDPTHKNFFGVNWFSYFDPTSIYSQKYSYSKAQFSVLNIEFDREWKINSKIIHRLFIKMANKRPQKYEQIISHLYPLNSITFHLQCLKSK